MEEEEREVLTQDLREERGRGGMRERESLIYLRFEIFNLNLNKLKQCHLFFFFFNLMQKNDVVLDLILILILGSKRHRLFFYFFTYIKAKQHRFNT